MASRLQIIARRLEHRVPPELSTLRLSYYGLDAMEYGGVEATAFAARHVTKNLPGASCNRLGTCDVLLVAVD